MAFVSRKRVGAMRGRRWIRSFARPAVAVVAAMREEQRRSKRVGSFRAEGVADGRRGERGAPAAAIGSWQAGAGEEAEEEASRERRETRLSARPSATRWGLQCCFLEMSTRKCNALLAPLAAFSYFQGVYMTIVKVRS